MSATPAQDVRALCDRLEQAHAAATGGVWKLWGMAVDADVDGTSNLDTSIPVAQTYARDENGKPRTWDATLICEAHNALPALVSALRAVADLADELDKKPHTVSPIVPRVDISRRLRSALAAALSPTEVRP